MEEMNKKAGEAEKKLQKAQERLIRVGESIKGAEDRVKGAENRITAVQQETEGHLGAIIGQRQLSIEIVTQMRDSQRSHQLAERRNSGTGCRQGPRW